LYDPSYRYKINLPKFDVVDKKGTRITLFHNSKSFADELQFDEELLVNLVAKGLACQTGYDNSMKVYYFKCINMKILDVLCEIIQKYLICKSCDRPEVLLRTHGNDITQRCKACGAASIIENNSLNDKTYETFHKFLIKMNKHS
jgi:translation initiation factor 5